VTLGHHLQQLGSSSPATFLPNLASKIDFNASKIIYNVSKIDSNATNFIFNASKINLKFKNKTYRGKANHFWDFIIIKSEPFYHPKSHLIHVKNQRKN
jgi:hypothetical protein